MFNLQLAVEVLAEISLSETTVQKALNLPDWDQISWGETTALTMKDVDDGVVDAPMCGTSFCFAGWALHKRGYRMVWEGREWASSGSTLVMRSVTDPLNGENVEVDEAAAQLLGIPAWEFWDNEAETYALFASSNSYEDLIVAVAELADLPFTEVEALVADERARIIAEHIAHTIQPK